MFYCPRQRIRLEGPEGKTRREPLLTGALYFFDSPSTPPARQIGSELQSTTAGMKAAAPGTLALENQYAPQYMGLDLNTLQTFLKGTGDQAGFIKMLGETQPQLDTMNAVSETAGRAGDVSDLAKLGPGALEALRSANPNQARLLDALNTSAQTNLQAGSKLTPWQQLQANQATRGGQAARGMGFGPSDVLSDTLGQEEFGQNLLESRQRFGTTMAGVNQSTTTSPIMELLARLRGNTGQGMQLLSSGMNAGRTTGPRMFDPQNSYASDVYNTNYNADAAARIAKANNSNALIGGGISAFGNILSSAISPGR
jgi:hypothetical protein